MLTALLEEQNQEEMDTVSYALLTQVRLNHMVWRQVTHLTSPPGPHDPFKAALSSR